jgi:hypothetical protein
LEGAQPGSGKHLSRHESYILPDKRCHSLLEVYNKKNKKRLFRRFLTARAGIEARTQRVAASTSLKQFIIAESTYYSQTASPGAR